MRETFLSENAFLFSETDEKGMITFVNDEFCNVSGYCVEELVNNPHNIIRHQDMPKAAFEDLWKTVQAGNVWHGYVKNKTKNDGFYWVYATVYPYKNENGEQRYMSCRRKPSAEEVNKASMLYKFM